MKALILAAGLGTRLGELTKDRPKCMVCVQGETILERQINSLREAGIHDIYVVIGCHSNVIKSNFSNEDVTFIENFDYASTNNMYSCFLAKTYLYDQDFILMNGDVFIEPEILIKFSQEIDAVCVDTNYYKADSMKVILQDSYIKQISKQIVESESRTSSIDIYSFSKNSSKIYFDYITEYLQTNKKDWNEVALNYLFSTQTLKFRAVDIYPLTLEEIDDTHDLKNAWIKFSPPVPIVQNYYIDLDGTTLLGEEFIDGAVGKINSLVGKNITFITNNTSKSPNYFREILSKEITVPYTIINPLIDIAKDYKSKRCCLFLTKDSKEYLIQQGIIEDVIAPEIIIVGYNTEFCYDDLAQICLLIQQGTKYVLTHTDVKCPSLHGFIPDVGALSYLIECTCNIKPLYIYGKHQKIIEPGIVIGDRLYTDGKLALNNNCFFVLVDRDSDVETYNGKFRIISSLADL